jgi:transcriptional regulator with XRE-family HTH domain
VSTTKLSESKLASSKEYRDAFVSAFLKRFIPFQIRTIRKKRGISQKELAEDSAITQGVVSRAEDPDYGNLTFNTALRVASGFDLAFVGKFVGYSELLKIIDEMSEDAWDLPGFVKECELEAAAAIPKKQAVAAGGVGSAAIANYMSTPLGGFSKPNAGIMQSSITPAVEEMKLVPASVSDPETLGSTEIGFSSQPKAHKAPDVEIRTKRRPRRGMIYGGRAAGRAKANSR